MQVFHWAKQIIKNFTKYLKQTKKLVVDKRYDGLWDSGEKFYHYALLCSEGLNEYLEELDNQTVEESGQRFDQSLFFNDNSKFYNWVNSKYFASILNKTFSIKEALTGEGKRDDDYFRQWCSEKNENKIENENIILPPDPSEMNP